VVVRINGEKAEFKTENNYAVIDREWKQGDLIDYILPLNIHRVVANSNVEADKNKVALERGPIVYCLEGVDNPDMYGNLILPDDVHLSANFEKNKLSGVIVITGEEIVSNSSANGLSKQPKIRPFTAIPYFSWCNRGITQMKVWLPRTESAVAQPKQGEKTTPGISGNL
jgi:DUF1680 family protein